MSDQDVMRFGVNASVLAAILSLQLGRSVLAGEGSVAQVIARQEAESAKAIKRSHVVVWGEIDERSRLAPGTIEILAHRVFKGSVTSPRLRVRIARKLTHEDREEVSAWFLAGRQDGLYEEVAPASLMADYYFFDLAARMERTPFRGMKPRRIADGIVLDLGVDSGLGPVSKAPPRPIHRDQVILVGQVTNFGGPRTILGGSETSELDRGSPTIHLEIKDETGRDARTPDPQMMCGNLSELGDFINLKDRETLRFMVHFHYERLAPGTYSARLHYTVTRDIERLNVDGSFRRPDEAMLARAKTMWQGAVVSDWITFSVVSASEQSAGAPASPAR